MNDKSKAWPIWTICLTPMSWPATSSRIWKRG